MKILGEFTEKHAQRFEVEPVECVKELIQECGVPYNVFEKDGTFVTRKDVSHHGSPIYEDTVHDVRPRMERVLRALLVLKARMIEAGVASLRDFD